MPGLLLRVLGGVGYLGAFEMMAKVAAATGLTADPVRRLGALGVTVGEDAERLWQKLRLTNSEHARLASMADNWWRVAPGDEQAARALLYRLGPEKFTDRVLLAWAHAEAGAHDEAWHGHGAPAAALERAGLSVARRRLSGARGGKGAAARRGHARRRSGVDRGGFSQRGCGIGSDCRCGGEAIAAIAAWTQDRLSQRPIRIGR